VDRSARWMTVIFACITGFSVAHAQTPSAYPTRPIRIIAPFSPGGGADALGRTLAKKVTEIFNCQVIFDNRGGASGIIGTEMIARAAPDGYTLGFIMGGPHAINAAIRKNLPYHPVNDFSPVGLFTEVPFILVANPTFPAKSVKELVQLARAKPEAIDYASTGNGSSSHFAFEMLNIYANIKLNHISYKGIGGAVTDTLAGAVPITIQGPLGVLQHVAVGKLRALAVTSARRSSTWPDLPTIAEGGVPNYDFVNWYGVLAPPKTPTAIVERVNKAIKTSLQSKEVVAALATTGGSVNGSTPEEFRRMVMAEIAKYTDLVNKMGGLSLD
jgi:tripartite-type tricarboxylate transporter receptor subunit TctC